MEPESHHTSFTGIRYPQTGCRREKRLPRHSSHRYASAGGIVTTRLDAPNRRQCRASFTWRRTVPIRHVTHETRSLIPDEQRAKSDRARWICTTRPESEPANGTAPPNLGSPHCGIYWQLRGEYTRCTARGSDIARPRLVVESSTLYAGHVASASRSDGFLCQFRHLNAPVLFIARPSSRTS